MNTKRVFIIGAGFSKQVGMPLATELIEPLLQRFKQINHDEMLNWYKNLAKRLKWLEGDKINIEQVFDLASFDIEGWRMADQCKSFGGNIADDIQSWLGWMERDLPYIIWENQKESEQKINIISKFSENLRIDDVIITFNYDTLLEKSLSEQNKSWNYGFEMGQEDGIKILKMHGSINWEITNKEANSSNQTLFISEMKSNQSKYKDILNLVPEKEIESFIKINHKCWKLKNPVGIAGLGAYKPLHRLPGSWKVWSNAYNALKETEEIYIIGFCLSPFDGMARLHFARAMLERNTNGNISNKIVLIDPEACSLKSNFEKVFGKNLKISIYQNKAEEINWSQLLSE